MMSSSRPATALVETTGRCVGADVREYAKASYPMTSTSVTLARRDVCSHLERWEWGTNETTYAARMIVTELVANAVKHARRRDHELLLHLAVLVDGDLIVEVSDPVPDFPCFEESAGSLLDDESGRGLMLVRSYSSDLSWFPRPHIGKTVRALLPAPRTA